MQLDPQAVWLAFALTLFAGMATGIGSALAFFAKRTNTRFLAIALGFSAGVMLYVSFMEILPKGIEKIAETRTETAAAWLGVGAFFAGILLIGIIDRLVPKADNPHEVRTADQLAQLRAGGPETPASARRLLRMGLLAAIAITIHNFPEGMVTFVAALDDPRLGIALAVAIAIHNIPEGISVSVPIYYATGSRKRAFVLSFLSGLAEPIGAVVAYFTLNALLGGPAVGILFAGVAGIMVFVSLDELLPTAREYGDQHEVLYGIVAGMAIMALSLLLLA